MTLPSRERDEVSECSRRDSTGRILVDVVLLVNDPRHVQLNKITSDKRHKKRHGLGVSSQAMTWWTRGSCRCGTDSRLELTRLGGPDLSPYESTCTYETLVDMGSKFSLGRLILKVIIRRLTNNQTGKRGAYHAKFRQFVVQKL